MNLSHGIIAVFALTISTIPTYFVLKIIRNMDERDWRNLLWYLKYEWGNFRKRIHIYNILIGFLSGISAYFITSRLLRSNQYNVKKTYLIRQNEDLIKTRQKLQQELLRIRKENKELQLSIPSNKRIAKVDQSVQTQTTLRRAYEIMVEKVKPGAGTVGQKELGDSIHDLGIESLTNSHALSDERERFVTSNHNLNDQENRHSSWIYLGKPLLSQSVSQTVSQTGENLKKYWNQSISGATSFFRGKES